MDNLSSYSEQKKLLILFEYTRNSIVTSLVLTLFFIGYLLQFQMTGMMFYNVFMIWVLSLFVFDFAISTLIKQNKTPKTKKILKEDRLDFNIARKLEADIRQTIATFVRNPAHHAHLLGQQSSMELVQKFKNTGMPVFSSDEYCDLIFKLFDNIQKLNNIPLGVFKISDGKGLGLCTLSKKSTVEVMRGLLCMYCTGNYCHHPTHVDVILRTLMEELSEEIVHALDEHGIMPDDAIIYYYAGGGHEEIGLLFGFTCGIEYQSLFPFWLFVEIHKILTNILGKAE